MLTIEKMKKVAAMLFGLPTSLHESRSEKYDWNRNVILLPTQRNIEKETMVKQKYGFILNILNKRKIGGREVTYTSMENCRMGHLDISPVGLYLATKSMYDIDQGIADFHLDGNPQRDEAKVAVTFVEWLQHMEIDEDALVPIRIYRKK